MRRIPSLFLAFFLAFSPALATADEERGLAQTLEERARTFTEQQKQGAISSDGLQETIDLITKEAKSITGQTLQNAILLLKLKDEVSVKNRALRRLNTDIAMTQSKLQEIADKGVTLREELAAIGRTKNVMEAKVRTTRVRLAETESAIDRIARSIVVGRAAMDQEKKRFGDVLRLLYFHKRNFGSADSLQTNIFKVLLADARTSEVLGRTQALASLEKIGAELFRKLVEQKQALEMQEQTLSDERQTLDVLHTELQLEERDIQAQEAAKKQLLELTRGEERLFQELLIQAQREEAQVTLELQNLRDNVSYINDKLSLLKDNFDPDQFEYIVKERAKSARELGITIDLERLAVVTDLEWPVLPKRGLSAHFRDAEYQRFFGVRHNAIDIPTPQGTPIHAPAAGLVYRVKDNGIGYNFIILAHPGGLQTVYGHVSDFAVREGDFVTRGQIIGYTGGTPGSKGAGWLTTGPHLHFEVLVQGQWVDPLKYLPLELLPPEYRPEPVEVRR